MNKMPIEYSNTNWKNEEKKENNDTNIDSTNVITINEDTDDDKNTNQFLSKKRSFNDA